MVPNHSFRILDCRGHFHGTLYNFPCVWQISKIYMLWKWMSYELIHMKIYSCTFYILYLLYRYWLYCLCQTMIDNRMRWLGNNKGRPDGSTDMIDQTSNFGNCTHRLESKFRILIRVFSTIFFFFFINTNIIKRRKRAHVSDNELYNGKIYWIK